MKKKIIFNILMALPLVVIIFSLFFLPARIPAHYDEQFVVNRWGSKYELLVLGIVPIIFGAIMKALMPANDKKRNQNVQLYGGICGLAVLNIIVLGFVYNAFRLTSPSGPRLAANLTRIIFMTLGVVFIILGRLMSKTEPNHVTGVRIPGAQSGRKTWEVNQKAGGISMMRSGVFIIIINLIFRKGQVTIFLTIAAMVFIIPATLIIKRHIKTS